MLKLEQTWLSPVFLASLVATTQKASVSPSYVCPSEG